MPDPLRDLAARAAADPAAVRELARHPDLPAVLAVAGPAVGLAVLARLPERPSAAGVRAALPLIADTSHPVPARLAAAARLLDGADAATAQAVLTAVLTAAPESARLGRLYALQRLVEVSEPLDRAVDQLESAPHPCPVCGLPLTRPGLVAHLWTAHRQMLIDGRPSDPRPLIDAAVEAANADPTGEATDRAFLLSAHLYPDAAPALVFQTLARGSPDPTQTDRLVQRAADAHAGVCPVCLTAVADPIPPLPPPAEVGHGRLAADGFVAAVRDRFGGRTVELFTPAGPVRPPATKLHPQLAAALYALPVFAVGLLATLVLPRAVAPPAAVAGGGVAAGWLTFFLLRAGKPLADPTDQAVGLAWRELVPGVGRSPAAVRFLTRLCRGSLGFGDPGRRAGQVHELAEQAAVLDRKGEAYSQLAAVAAVLRAADAVRIGREPVAAVAEVFRPFARGQATLGYAEAAAETVLADLGMPADDLLRLGVSLSAVMFDAGLTPPDVLLIVRFAPWLRKLLPADPDHLAGLFAVWQMAVKGVPGPGPATTVFDLAANNPPAGRRLLHAHPDALLRLGLGPAADAAVGAVVLTGRGLRLGGLLADDPDGRLEVVRTGLRVGDGVLAADAPVPPRLPDQLRDWLVWRTSRLLPRADAALAGAPTQAADRLAAVAADCPLCGARCAWRAGRLATPWHAVAGA
jgi:hypothetical protein